MDSLLPPRTEGVPTPRNAHPETLSLCHSEQDAVKASIALSGLTQTELSQRIGISKQALGAWKQNGVPHKRTRAFCNATGTNLIVQYREYERAMRSILGHERESDRIAQIIAPTERAWGSYDNRLAGIRSA